MNWPDELKPGMIKAARKALRMKQDDLAELLMYSRAGVCQWEIGRRVPRGTSWNLFLIMMKQQGITFAEDGTVLFDSPKKNKRKVA